LPVRRLDKLSSSPAAIRVDTYPDAYAEGWLLIVGLQTGLDALGDLFRHPLI